MGQCEDDITIPFPVVQKNVFYGFPKKQFVPYDNYVGMSTYGILG